MLSYTTPDGQGMEPACVPAENAGVLERQVIALVWSHIQSLLASSATDEVIKSLTAMLPDPSSFQSAELPVLAKLHLSSAGNLMGTLKLLAPAAFAPGSCQPDLSALDDADSGLLSMAATLIELQLFHLTRTAALTEESRKRLAQQRCAALSCATGSSSCCSVGSAGSSGAADEQDALGDLLDMSE